MSDHVTTPQDTTPASSGGDVIAGLSSEARSHWRMTGELPGQDSTVDGDETPPVKEPDVTRESSPATPVDRAAEIAAKSTPASEPGTPSKKSSNAETRKAELNAEILALKAERDRLKSEREALTRPSPPPPDVTQGSPPAPADLLSTIERPDVTAPILNEDSFWERFPDAKIGDYARYVARYENRAADAQRYESQSRHERQRPFIEQRDAKLKDDPGFLDRIDGRVKGLVPVDLLPPGTAPKAGNVIAQAIMTSPSAMALMEHLTAHPDVLSRLEASPSGEAILREIGRIEAKLESSSTTVPSAAPAALPVSLAPPPPATLGTKPAQPADELSEAIRAGDFARYRELQNRKELKHA